MNGGRGHVGIITAASCAVILVGAVAGCTPGPTTPPSPTPSVVASPLPTPTPTPTPDAAVKPERPAAMDEVSAAGAEAAAVYFLQLYPYVYATGDLEEWRELSHPECVFCASVITNVEEQVAAGGRSEGGLIHIESVETSEVSDGYFSVFALATQEAGREYGPGGEALEESTGSHSEVIMVILWAEYRWSVRAVQVDGASGV